MPKTITVYATNVDLTLLRQQSRHLANIEAFLLGSPITPASTEAWTETIEGLQGLIAALLRSGGEA